MFPIITRNSDFLFPDPEDYYLMGLGTTAPRGWGTSTFMFLPSAAGLSHRASEKQTRKEWTKARLRSLLRVARATSGNIHH